MLVLGLLSACGSTEPAPRWKVEAANASERFVEAWLSGEQRVEQVEFERARERVTRTGRADLVARIELLRCAARIAALVIEPCTGFESVRRGLSPGTETAYAAYLAGELAPDASVRIAQLPPAQRAVAALPAGQGISNDAQADQAVGGIDDPLSQLVAAGVLVRTGRAGDAVIARAVDTASKQGWRRALLAWLTLQKQRAEAVGNAALAQGAQRRIDLVAPRLPKAELR